MDAEHIGSSLGEAAGDASAPASARTSESAAGSRQEAEAKYALAAWIELVSVLILSLGMLASAWRSYQASLWAGQQTFALARSMAAGRESSRLSVPGNQRRTADGQLFVA